MGRTSRRKGADAEREAAAALDAEKVSYAWKPGEDLRWRNRTVEVKRRKDSWKQIRSWLEDAEILMLRADRDEWIIAMRLPTFLDVVDVEERRGNQEGKFWSEGEDS